MSCGAPRGVVWVADPLQAFGLMTVAGWYGPRMLLPLSLSGLSIEPKPDPEPRRGIGHVSEDLAEQDSALGPRAVSGCAEAEREKAGARSDAGVTSMLSVSARNPVSGLKRIEDNISMRRRFIRGGVTSSGKKIARGDQARRLSWHLFIKASTFPSVAPGKELVSSGQCELNRSLWAYAEVEGSWRRTCAERDAGGGLSIMTEAVLGWLAIPKVHSNRSSAQESGECRGAQKRPRMFGRRQVLEEYALRLFPVLLFSES
jgi:hypothetical protein